MKLPIHWKNCGQGCAPSSYCAQIEAEHRMFDCIVLYFSILQIMCHIGYTYTINCVLFQVIWVTS
jgi:hypothetical protein